MIRKIIQIDTDKCNGCGACANACHEGAIAMVNGKAKLMRDDYCDGFGDCLPHCPTGAITFVEREAAAYDEKAVEENKRQKAAAAQKPLGGCPGSAARSVFHQPAPQMHHGCPGSQMRQMQHKPEPAGEDMPVLRSQLSQWPVQIKLVPVNAPYFDGAKLLIAADCTAYAYANFHQKFIRGHITLVGCPKLDDVDYSEKLTQIIRENNIQSVTVVRMEVPAAAGWNAPPRWPCRTAASSSRGRSSPSPLTAISSASCEISPLLAKNKLDKNKTAWIVCTLQTGSGSFSILFRYTLVLPAGRRPAEACPLRETTLRAAAE